MSFFRRRYGASPLHLLGSLAALALIYIPLHWLWEANPTHHVNLIAWLLLFAILHDALFLPIYVILDLITRVGIGDHALRPVRAINHIRFPFVMAGVAFIVYWPLIVGNGRENYLKDLGQEPPDYLGRFLLMTAGLFLASGIVYAVRLRRASRPAAPAAPAGQPAVAGLDSDSP